jgi:S-adenosylmethionine:tRNA ribosyltransferase-isomerase
MKLNDFNYTYPDELVAQRPLEKRDASRMMFVDRRAQRCVHEQVTDLPSHLSEGDVLVVNDSRVMPMRLFGELSGGKPIELLLVETIDELKEGEKEVWKSIIRRAKRYRRGDVFFFGIAAKGHVVGHDGTYLLVEFQPGHRERAMKRKGVPPLPPYIKRDAHESYTNEDRERYQTVYAKKDGSAAAPTAGLHLSDDLIGAIEERGVEIVPVTLHVGLDTFQPVRAELTRDHDMHGERYIVTEESAHAINRARGEGRRIIAVGTTAVRALESAWQRGQMRAGAGTTNLFITPGYIFRVIEGLLTNFHQPKSTLLMMISAFAGREFILKCYEEAIRARYRLFSFGDCMAIF